MAIGSGIPDRVVAGHLTVPLNPGAPGYRFVDALGFRSEAPVAVVSPPGETNRLFIVEQRGRILVVTNLAAPTRTVFLDIRNRTAYGGEQGLLGLAFHPRYAQNGRFFVFRTQMTGPPGVRYLHDVLSEFRVSANDPNVADSESEIPLFREPDDAANHNGGDLHFGPDGYLYVAVGDEGGGNDNYGNSQRIDRDLFAGILRIDVDRRPGSLPPNRDLNNPAETFAYTTNYAIPSDNPFVGATSFLGRAVEPDRVRTEFWAVGLRNPWRFSFDRSTGELWIGDVGQSAQEMVFVTRKGANHGWAFREGTLPGPKGGAPAGFLTNPEFNYVAPLYTYPHGIGPMRGRSVTGGVVYRGRLLSALHGAYIFGDYVGGNVWSLKRDAAGGRPVVTRLTGFAAVSAFGTDPRDGAVLACQLNTGLIGRLEYDAEFSGDPLPPLLSGTGAFTDLATLTPADGMVPYDVNLSFWSDGASKQRWFALPSEDSRIGFSPEAPWTAPEGTVWVKHFELQTVPGDSASRRRVETRFLVRNDLGVHGFTYRWNSPSEALLVPEEGDDEVIEREVDGTMIPVVWRYPGRAECLACHTPQAGHTLSFKTAQLNREIHGFSGTINQLAALSAAGYFSNPPASTRPLRRLAAPEDASVSLEYRARSWLAVNCAPCHRSGGTGGGGLDLRLATRTASTGILFGRLNDDGGDPANLVLLPGDPFHSQLLQRMAVRGPRQMPPLASEIPDPAGVQLIMQWIDELGDPPAQAASGLEALLDGGRVILRAVQPANRSLNLEEAGTLGSDSWEFVDLPGNDPSYPSEPREWQFEIPDGDRGLFRIRPESP